MARLTLQLLGGFVVRLQSGRALRFPMRKAQALMAYLAVPPGRAHSRDKLASVLWGNTGDEQARQSLRQTLVALRRALPAARPPILIVDRDTLALDPGAVEVDVEAFERAAAGGSAKALEHAVALYQGDLLEGMRVTEEAFEDWLRVERARLRRCAVDALTRLLAYQSRAGATEGAVHTAARLLALDPLQESAHRALMRLYARQGRRGEALRQYQLCVDVLRRELQTEPEAETKHLYRELVQQTVPRGAIRDAVPPPAPHDPAGAAPGPVPHVTTAEGQLIGREAEVARLRQAWEAGRLGRGQVVLIVGEAGIGKSRLLAEMAVEATAQGGRFLLGRCYESEQILPFGPWVDAVRTGRIIGDEVLLGTMNPAWRAELTRLVPEVAASGGPVPTDDRLRLFESVMHLVEQLAATRPVVLGLEDLHWADEISLRLLAFVARRIRTAAVLIVATVREDEPGSAEVLRLAAEELDREPHCQLLVLSPLSRADTTALVRTLARTEGDNGVTTARAEQVWAISEGNPFLAVEALRALQDGAMPPESNPGLWLPAGIRGLIVRRLDRLSAQGQELAAVAAVIGRGFEFALIQRAAGLIEREAAQAMEELVRRRILHGVGERFDFTHDRIREAIATSLLAPRRKVLHGQVATAIEDLYTPQLEPHATALGLHYLRAEAWDKASAYLLQAGKAARWRIALREAIACLNHALGALEHLPRSRMSGEQTADVRLELWKACASYASPLHGRVLALDHLREAERLADDLGDKRRLARILTALAGEYWLLGDYGSSMDAGQRAVAIGSALGDVEIQIGARSLLARVHHSLGDFDRARSLYEDSLRELRAPRKRESLRLLFAYAVSSARLAWTLIEYGEFSSGLARATEAAEICHAIGRSDGAAHAMYSIGLVHLSRGDFQRAIVVLEEGLAACRSRDDLPLQVLPTTAHLGWAYALSGRVAEGLALLEQSVQGAERMAVGWSRSLWSTWWAEALLHAGRVEDAVIIGRDALDLAMRREERGQEAYARRLFGEIASHDGTHGLAEAERHYGQAVSLAAELGMRPLIAHCHLGLGKLYRAVGQRQGARERLAAAAAMYREMDMPFWLEQAATPLED